MRRALSIGVLPFFALAVCDSIASAQVAGERVNPNQGFDLLYEATTEYRERADEGTVEAALADSLFHSLVELENAWWDAGMPWLHADYVASLEAAAGALQVPGDSLASLEALRETSADLQLKADFAEEADFADHVEVTVVTKRGDQEVDGLLVRANPRGRREREPPQYVFNSSSSPTSRAMPPGNHIMWVETPEGTRLVCVDLTLGVDGDTSETVEVTLTDEPGAGCE